MQAITQEKTQLEKENLLLRANTLLKKPEQDYQEDDLLIKRVIF